ncbi:XRE family transcriptional regulator [Ruminococcaceae bacterium OttesenSCG-928-A16]|nr:XRE family transcriptional regulator [Ruminococcaceae bacterium OttesenSCG-928-A16]
MAKIPLCKFGKQIKQRLNEISETQAWLIAAVSKNTGLYFDTGYMHRILVGKSKNPNIIASICQLLCIEYTP